MDATSHLAHVSQYRDYQGSTSRPSMSRSQTTGSTGPNEIDFGIPDVRPGLARIGRRLTEMSENFLYDDVKSPDSGTKRPSTTTMSTAVPFMGDEPVFCPFCDKPLPPALLLQHMTTAGQEVDQKANPRLAGVESSSMAKTASAPDGSTKQSPLPPGVKPNLHKQPSGIAASRPNSPMSAAQLAANVKEADSVDSAAGKLLLDTDTLRKWSKIAGVELDLPSPPDSASTSTKKEDIQPQPLAKPFPKLAPPPEDSSRSSSRNSSKFSLFGKGKNKPEDEEEDESDDDLGGAGGYARLDAPASPERVERELPSLKKRAVEERDVSANAETTREEPEEMPEPAASDTEVRELLKEVLTKINEVSKSHASVLHSHSTLLTTLKIARSNLAMAEANAEMLEEQLKRQTSQNVKPPTSTGPARLPTSSMGPPLAPKPAPIRTSTTGPGAGEGQIAKTEPATPRRSVEAVSSSRPQSIQIPSSTNPRTPMSASSDSSKGMFGSFWNRNKDKVGEFMSSLPDLTPTAERSSFDFAKSPTNSAVPYGAAVPDYRSAPAPAPGLNRSKTVHGRAGESDSLARSSSYTNVQTAKPPTDPYMQELSRLRQLDRSSQQKIEVMTKELAEMKKGKVEMEAELENLSQALFEEANKMVADEKKRRVEMEEALKEVKAEREALRDTIKVLGGQVESESSVGDPEELQVPNNGVVAGASPDFAPRDLDKHYEALRKSIHHVADDTEWNEEEDATDPAGDAERPTTPVKTRRHSLPEIASPEPPKAPALHDPWADSDTSAPSSSAMGKRGASSSPNRFRSQIKPLTSPSDEFGSTDTGSAATASESGSRRSSSGGPVSPKAEKLDALDEMMEKMQADIELESPKKEKKNPL